MHGPEPSQRDYDAIAVCLGLHPLDLSVASGDITSNELAPKERFCNAIDKLTNPQSARTTFDFYSVLNFFLVHCCFNHSHFSVKLWLHSHDETKWDKGENYFITGANVYRFIVDRKSVV